MSYIYKFASRIPNYVRRFGFFTGLKICLSVESFKQRSKTSENIAIFKIPNYQHTIHLRNTVSDHAIFWQCMVMEQYSISHFPHSRQLDQVYNNIISKNKTPVIIDCGGNIGLSAIYYANKYPHAKIIVVEPDTDNFKVLIKNTEKYGQQIQAFKGGVWNSSGFLKITNPDSGASAFQVELTTLTETPDAVKCFTISELKEVVDNAVTLIVKVDIEGAQKQVFSSNTEWISQAPLIILELDDWLMPSQGTSQSFFKAVSQYPFEYLINAESIFCFNSNIFESN